MSMTDDELAEYLHLTPAEAAIVIPKLTPERRALYDRMKQIEIEAVAREIAAAIRERLGSVTP